MSATHEFRVRPVQRFVVTHYESDGQSASVREVGEFPNVGLAEQVVNAMRLTVAGGAELPQREYVVVASDFQVGAMVFFAYSEEEAEERRLDCEARYGGTFRVFSRGFKPESPPQ